MGDPEYTEKALSRVDNRAPTILPEPQAYKKAVLRMGMRDAYKDVLNILRSSSCVGNVLVEVEKRLHDLNKKEGR